MRKWIALNLASLTLLASLPAFPADQETITVPAGTHIEVRLMTALSSRANQEGDPWSGHIVEPIFIGGEEVIPVGSTLGGRVTYVKDPGRVKGKAEMRLLAETITTPQDVKYTVLASLEDVQGAEGIKLTGKEGAIQGPGKDKKGAAKEAGIATGAGAAGGLLLGGGTGALYGAGIGLLASAIHSIAKRGKDVILPLGTEMTFNIDRNTKFQRATKPGEATNPQAESNQP
ncbi:MAG: hypothetical protein ACE145_20995 [Terriglobia bacterium]